MSREKRMGIIVKYSPFIGLLVLYVVFTLNVSELARVCGLSRPTVYKYLKLVR